MSDDEAEMAALRRSRQAQFARQHRHRHRPAEEEEEEEEQHPSTDISLRSGTVESDENEDDGTEAAMLRASLPAAFGVKSKPVTSNTTTHTTTLTSAVHNTTTRGIQHSLILPTAATPVSAATHTSNISHNEHKAAEPIVKIEGQDNDDDDDDVNATPSSSAAAAALAALIRQYHLPITHEVTMPCSNKSVSALCLDPSGARLLAGSYDYHIRMYDFGGMNNTFKAFREIEAQEGHPVIDVAYNPQGDTFLCATTSSCIKLYNRDGFTLSETIAGDRYLLDQKNTKGHTAAVTCVAWHPQYRGVWASGSRDGTVRIWERDSKSEGKECSVVLKLRGTQRGVAVSAFGYNHTGKQMIIAATDGSLRLFTTPTASNASNPALPLPAALRLNESKIISAAHTKERWISSVVFTRDDRYIISRGGEGDDNVCIWDAKTLSRQAVAIIHPLYHTSEHTNMCLSPDGQLLFTPCSMRSSALAPIEQHQHGCIAIISLSFSSSAPPALLTLLPISTKPVLRVCCHSVLCQLFLSCADGSIHVLYDLTHSTKGVLLCVGRTARTKRAAADEDTNEYIGEIITPHALPMFRQSTSSRKKQRQQLLQDTIATKQPLPPLPHHGSQGRLPTSANMTQFMMEKIVKRRVNRREQDPREALLAMEEKARADPIFTKAYHQTQPVPIFETDEQAAGSQSEEEEDEKGK